MKVDEKQRLHERILDRVYFDPNTGCWLWTGHPTGKEGYGALSVNWRRVRAHRLSYELFVGPVADGICVCHTCDTPPCVNPGHLFLGTRADNNRDMTDKGRRAQGPKLVESCDTKLTPAKVKDIRARAGPETQGALAAEYGVHKTTISLVVCRKTWKHIA